MHVTPHSRKGSKHKMKILKGTEIPVAICISYTMLSITNSILSLLSGREATSNWNDILMLILTSIAILVLSMHRLFDALPPLLMMVLQYVIAMSLVMLFIYITSFFEEISEGGYWDIFLSFTIPYIIGAACYYVSVFRAAKRQDALIQEINTAHNPKDQD